MLLAQALSKRKALKQELANIQRYIKENTYAGDDDPNKLIGKYNRITLDLVQLIADIDYTNNVTIVGSDSLQRLRIVRDEYTAFHNGLLAISSNKFSTVYGNGQPLENKIDLEELKNSISSYARLIREYDDLIQKTNWNTELLDSSGQAAKFRGWNG